MKESFLVRWLPVDAIAGVHDINNFGPEAQINTISQRFPHPLYAGLVLFNVFFIALNNLTIVII